MTKTETYCRACGKNKGHSLERCKNAAALRTVIRCLDGEIDGLMAGRSCALAQAQDAEEELARVKAQWREVEENRVFLARVSFALLDLAELKRAKATEGK